MFEVLLWWQFWRILLYYFRYDKKANEAQQLQQKLAQAKAQIDKLDQLARDNSVRYLLLTFNMQKVTCGFIRIF